MRPIDIIQKKKNGQKISVLTAYESIFSQLLSEAEIDIVLVGDSLGNVFSGFDNTLPVTMEHMIYHTQAVTRAKPKGLVVADMPFMSYHSPELAKHNAGRLIAEGGAQAVKLEIQPATLECARLIVGMGIPVMGHIGFTPQWVNELGYRVQGRDNAEQLLKLAKQVESSGCFSVVLEMVPQDLTKKITESVSIPTIGIGAGKYCDGQVLVTQDLLGLNRHAPKFVKPYGQFFDQMKQAIQAFKSDVENERFPDESHSYL